MITKLSFCRRCGKRRYRPQTISATPYRPQSVSRFRTLIVNQGGQCAAASQGSGVAYMGYRCRPWHEGFFTVGWDWSWI